MLANFNSAQVLKTSSRDVANSDGTTTTFVSTLLLVGNDPISTWSFSTDFQSPPAVGTVIDAEVDIRAKTNDRNPQYPRLSVRLKSFAAKA